MTATIAELQVKANAQELDKLSQSLERLAEANKKLGQSEKDVSKSGAEDSTARQEKINSTEKTLGLIDKQTKSLAVLAQRQKELNALQSSGAIDTETYEKYNGIIESNIAMVNRKGNAVVANARQEVVAEEKRYQTWLKTNTQQQVIESRSTSLRDQNAAKNAAAAEKELLSEEKRYNSWLKANTQQQVIEAQAVKQRQKRERDELVLANAEEKRYQNWFKMAEARDKVEKRQASTRQQSSKRVVDNSAAEARALQNVIDSIDQNGRALRDLDRQQQTLNRSKLQSENPAEYQRLNSMINARRSELQKLSKSYGDAGISAKQLRLAQMGLPAQFTDIAVSLQGGMPPLTVFLQQGGQIKDMFGGIGPAIRGVTGAIIGMINPITVAATVIGALAIAVYKGSTELDNLNAKAIITGRQLGLTKEGFHDMARSISSSTGTMGSAVDLLEQIAEKGDISAANMRVVGETIAMVTKTGASDAETLVDAFSQIGSDPLKAAKSLQEQYRFLTPAIAESVRNLVEQGRKQEAVNTLTNAFADSLQSRVPDIQESYSKIGQAATSMYRSITAPIAGAWDWLKELDRTETATDRINKLSKDIAETKANIAEAQSALQTLNADDLTSRQAQESRLEREKQKLSELNAEYSRQNSLVSAQSSMQGLANKILSDRAKAVAAGSNINDAYNNSLSESTKLEKDLAKFRKENNVSGLTAQAQREYTAVVADYEKKIKEAKEREAKKGQSGSTPIDSTSLNNLKKETDLIGKEYDLRNEQVRTKLSEGEITFGESFSQRRKLISDEASELKKSVNSQITEINRLLTSTTLSEGQKISLKNQLTEATAKLSDIEVESQQKLEKVTQDAANRTKQLQKAEAQLTVTLQKKRETLQNEGLLMRERLTLTSEEIELRERLLQLERERDAALSDLTTQNLEKDDFEARTALIIREHGRMRDQVIENARLMKEAQTDIWGGVSTGFKQFIEDGMDLTTSFKNATVRSFESMSDAISDFVITGKLDFRSLTISILSDLAKIAVRAAASQALSAIFSGVSSGFGGMFSGATGATQAGYTGAAYQNWLRQENGGAWEGGTQFFANGGAFTNSVVSKPTAFSYQSGLGVMGEAGPEAIMPLKRASDGSLGVRASVDLTSLQGMSGGSSVNVVINISDEGTAVESTQGMNQFGKELGEFVEMKYNQLMRRDMKAGGQLHAALAR